MSNKLALPAGQHVEELSHDLCAELAIPYITSTGLKPDDDYTTADLIVFGRAATGIESTVMWLRGDTILEIEKRDQGVSVEAMAGLFGCSYKRLLSNRATCLAWPKEERMDPSDLGYSHHEELNRVDPEQRLAFQATAAENNLTVQQLRRLVSTGSPDLPTQVGSAPPFKWDQSLIESLKSYNVELDGNLQEVTMSFGKFGDGVIIRAVEGIDGPQLEMRVRDE